MFPDGQRHDVTEIDLLLDHARAFGPVAASVGVMSYHFPNGVGQSTLELHAGVALPDVLLAPSLTLIADVDEIGGMYASAGMRHGFALGEHFALDLRGALGWVSSDQAEDYFFSESGGLADALVAADLSYALSERSRLTLTLAQSVLIDSALRDGVEGVGIDPTPTWVAFSLGWTL